MAWSDIQQLRQVRRVHVGPLFDVFRARLGDRDVAIKRLGTATPWGDALASLSTHSDATNIFYQRQLGWTEDELPPGPSYFEALLRAEHAVIERAAASWNHPGARLAQWCDDDVIAPALNGEASRTGGPEDHPYRTSAYHTGALCLVMPWCGGTSFAMLPRAEQRRLFPAMLPALWTALAASPHGDLSPENLMLEREQGIFRILDPGVRITGPSRGGLRDSSSFGGRGSLSFRSEMLTTNATHYPLVMPEHGPDRPQLCASHGGLVRIVEGYASSLLEQWRGEHEPAAVQAHAPAAADVVACGAIYFGLLAGKTLASLFGIHAPLWTGFWSDSGHCPASPRSFLDSLTGGAIARALRSSGAGPAEIALCERLVMLDLDGDELANRASDVLRALG